MDHVAIMRKSWGLIPKILDGRKKIESRWSKNKCAPWGKVKIGDVVYFKNSGGPIVAKAKVSAVLYYKDLNPEKVRKIVRKHQGDGGISVGNLANTIKWASGKRYCTLVFLIKAGKVIPFNIDKKGFGIGAAWLCVGDINKIRR